MNKKFIPLLFCFFGALFLSCSSSKSVILNNLNEGEANVIVVFLESKGISAEKATVVSTGAGAESGAPKFNISVAASRSVEAMSLLNQNGLPQRQGTTLLELFSKSSFMSTDKEENIRYQAGLSQQLANVILMIDGVIAANVQLSFPDPNEETAEGAIKKLPTAAVFVKHQGIIDDPNSHLVLKIKLLISASVQDLTIDNVTVVSDKSRFTDVSPIESLKATTAAKADEQVKIWSITMNKNSTGKFRLFFFFLMTLLLLLGALLGWIIWKVYPTIKDSGGFAKLFNPIPFKSKNDPKALSDSRLRKGEQEGE